MPYPAERNPAESTFWFSGRSAIITPFVAMMEPADSGGATTFALGDGFAITGRGTGASFSTDK